MSAARTSLRQQATPSTGIPNYDGSLSRGVFGNANSNIAGRQIRLAQQITLLQNSISGLFSQDLRGPPGPAGAPGLVNVQYPEGVTDEFHVFSVQRLASEWVLSDANDRQADITTTFGFMPLGGLFADQDSSISYPIYHSAGYPFVPNGNDMSEVAISSVDLPNFTEVSFNTNRVITQISWNCPTAIAARFVMIGRPVSGTNYIKKYYQIQGEKIFEEFPAGSTLMTTQRRNESTNDYFTVPAANESMPQMKSLSVILYDIRYIPVSSRDSYDGTISSLSYTRDTPSSEISILSQGISLRFGCANYVS